MGVLFRGRPGLDLWKNKGIETIGNQYRIVGGTPATWLIQYDVLKDKELVDYIKRFDEEQEIGVLVEVSNTLTKEAKVPMEINRPWYDPGIVFLSGSERSER